MGAAPIQLDQPWTGSAYSPPTALDINALEQAIVAQLQAAIGNIVEVAHFPDRPEAYEMRHRIGVCLVIFAGSDYGKILDTGIVAQERTLEFEIGLRIRDLGWAYGGPPGGTSPGAYQLIEAIRIALTGFQPNTGCTPMAPRSEKFADRDRQGGVFVYVAHYVTRTVAVQVVPAPNFPLLQTGLAFEEGGQTTISVPAASMTFNGQNQISLGKKNVSNIIVTSQGGSVYVAGIDYSIDSVDGIITRLATGGIGAGATVNVQYAYADVVEALESGGSSPFNPSN